MAFLNVYRSGYYHRMGKPGQFNCHPGDLYPTHEAATADVDPDARHLYLGTFEVSIPAALLGEANPSDCVPIPLSQTRRLLRDPSNLPSEVVLPVDYRIPSHIEGMRPFVMQADNWIAHGSLDTSEAEAQHLTTEQVISRWGNGEAGR